MFKTLALAAIATVALTSFAEAQQRGYGQRGGGYGQRGGYNQAYRGGNYNNSFNRNVYVKNGGNGNAWAAAGAGLAVGALLGVAAAQPSYAAPAYGYGYAAPAYGYGYAAPVTVVPNCYYVTFIDAYRRQSVRQVCD